MTTQEVSMATIAERTGRKSDSSPTEKSKLSEKRQNFVTRISSSLKDKISPIASRIS